MSNVLCDNRRDCALTKETDEISSRGAELTRTSPAFPNQISEDQFFFLKSADRARSTLLLQASSNMLSLQLWPQGAPRPRPACAVIQRKEPAGAELELQHLQRSVSGSTHEMIRQDLEEKVSSRFCDVDKWFIQQEW